MKKPISISPLVILILLAGCATVNHPAPNATEINSILDAFHKAASEADGEKYFSLFHSDAIFLGTDATERWTVPEFKQYADPHFSKGNGWTYRTTQRTISISPDGSTVWFDELLENEGLGTCRGSGLLLVEDGEWKIAQYNLSIPVPNELARRVVGIISGN